MIGNIERLPLRKVWKHEATDFTVWLEHNIEVLNETLALNLVSAEREQRAGTFSVDIVAEDQAGNPVIIENQLEKSNHDHLGKILTYLTSLEARTAIWIVAEPRPEHVKAIAWLNESSSASFYLVPLLTLITGPSAEAQNIGDAKKELAGRHIARRKFFTSLLDLAKTKTKLHAAISPSKFNWVGTSAGLPSGFTLSYVVRRSDAQVELYIDHDQDTGEGNTRIFEQLRAKKSDIEDEFGEPLTWEALEGRRACRIKKDVPGGGWMDEDNWPEVHRVMVDAMIRLNKSLRPHVKKLKQ
jgi:hypothetical protein